MGMKAATSLSACIYCVSKKMDYFRGVAESRDQVRLGDPGTKLPNLVPCFSPSDVITDVLHMYFRISDVLFDRMVEQEVADDPASRRTLHTELDGLGLKARLVTTERGTLQFSSLQCRDRDKLIEAIIHRDFLGKVMPENSPRVTEVHTCPVFKIQGSDGCREKE